MTGRCGAVNLCHGAVVFGGILHGGYVMTGDRSGRSLDTL